MKQTYLSKIYNRASEVVDVVNDYENYTLPPSERTEELFLTLAFWYSYLNPTEEARRQLENSVRRYAFEHKQDALDEKSVSGKFTVVQEFLNDRLQNHSFLELINRLLNMYADNALTDRENGFAVIARKDSLQVSERFFASSRIFLDKE